MSEFNQGLCVVFEYPGLMVARRGCDGRAKDKLYKGFLRADYRGTGTQMQLTLQNRDGFIQNGIIYLLFSMNNVMGEQMAIPCSWMGSLGSETRLQLF